MASVTYTAGTVIPSHWLNDVNSLIYGGVGSSLTRSAGGAWTIPGTMTLGAGTAAAPAIGIGEAGTGLYRIGVGQLGVTISGVLSTSWSANRNVTIAAPAAGIAATVAGANAVAAIALFSNANAVEAVVDVAAIAGQRAGIRIGGNAAALGTGSFDLYSTPTGVAQIINRANTALELWTNSLVRQTISSAGNVTIATPASGNTVTIEQNNTSISTYALSLTNTNASGQSPINWVINGTQRGRIRCDFVGNMSYSTSGGEHVFYTGGDAGTGVLRAAITSDGRLYGAALHNNAGAVTGTTNQYIASGTYNPAFTLVTNLDSTPTGTGWKWCRVGNTVILSGPVTIDPTAAASVTFRVSLPIASAFTAAGDASGICNADGDTAGVVQAAAATDDMSCALVSAVTTPHVARVFAMYEIL